MFTVSRFFLIFATVVLCGGLLLTGCKSDSSNPAGPGGGTGTGGTITVTGKVIGANSQPQSGVPVLILGTTIPSVNTDANGAFSIANVPTPYTVAVVDGAHKQALVYRGLTRTDPTLIWLDVTLGTEHTATLSGTIYPSTAYPEPVGRRSKVAYGSPEATASSNVNGTTGAYTITSNWYGPTTTTGTLYALQWSFNTTTGLPTSYEGFGSRSGIALLDATANPNGNDTMSVVAPATLSGSITVPSGYTLGSKSLSVLFASNASISLFTDVSASGSFTYTTPGINGATMTLRVLAGKVGVTSFYYKVGLSPSASGVSITVPVGPELSLPIDATTGVTKSSQFSWSPVPNAVHALIFQPPPGKPRYIVLTTAAADSIPDLSTAGLGLPAATNYSWSVFSFGPFASVDAAAGATGFLVGVLGSMPTSDAFNGESSSRGFTTAP